MSRLYEALRKVEREKRSPKGAFPDAAQAVELQAAGAAEPLAPENGRAAKIKAGANSRLVALQDPRSLGAEKFRSLATRLQNQRNQRDLKSVQITSSSIGEGKSLVSANLALTFSMAYGAKVLLVEGDLHRPSLAPLLGLPEVTGIAQWWEGPDDDLEQSIYRLDELPLWFLSAGGGSEQPSQILQSARFAKAFIGLSAAFDWIIVDSTPMTPTVDSNLWSRLVDGTLLVVREGVASVKALKKGLQALDNPKMVGIVLNEASEFDQTNYEDQYYALRPPKKGPEPQ
ncbi:MAG TPA: CpsD/CapB family tyrosine-protein kinase [Candidatus Acidoferrum sp.]